MIKTCKKCGTTYMQSNKGCVICALKASQIKFDTVKKKLEELSVPKIAAIDFDGTLVENNWPGIGPSKDIIVDFVKDLKEKGWKLILWTCRENEKLQEAVDFCKTKLDLTFDAINDNIPYTIERFGFNSRKINADIYLDDKALSDGDIFDKFWSRPNYNIKRLLKGG